MDIVKICFLMANVFKWKWWLVSKCSFETGIMWLFYLMKLMTLTNLILSISSLLSLSSSGSWPCPRSSVGPPPGFLCFLLSQTVHRCWPSSGTWWKLAQRQSMHHKKTFYKRTFWEQCFLNTETTSSWVLPASIFISEKYFFLNSCIVYQEKNLNLAM